MSYGFLIIGLIVGAVAGFFFARSKRDEDNSGILEERVRSLEEQLNDSASELKIEREAKEKVISEIAAERANNENLEQKLSEQQEEIARVRREMTREFENLANKIFEEKGKSFKETNKESLQTLLNPLSEKIKNFEEKVEKNSKESIEHHATLKEQITNLTRLNNQMSEDAQSLVKALRGESKTQGTWGEQILEKLLEHSGLKKGVEYETQSNLTDDETGGSRKPDVIVHLPDDKDLIIDSKVSLVAYDRFVNADTDEEREQAAKAHLDSVRKHIKELSEKRYQNLNGVKTLDFVFLFIPVEPAFSLALSLDDSLFTKALDQQIVIASPSTLLASLRAIASIWRQENQTRNATKIAEEAGKLYDKFVGFVEDLEKLGRQIDTSKKTYLEARNKLVDGRGNIVGKIENLKKMGAKSSKSIDTGMMQDAIGSTEENEPLEIED